MAVTWINPLLGGLLISISLCIFTLLNKMKYGIGDMLRSAIERGPSTTWNSSILFLLGLIVSPITFTAIFYPVRRGVIESEPLIIMLSGLLVGAGYRLCRGGLITRMALVGLHNMKISIIMFILVLIFGWLTQGLLMLF